MIFGLDLSPAYPFLAVLVLIFTAFFFWQLFGGVTRIAKNLKALSDQFGTNGGSTLRAELTALSVKVEGILTLLLKKVEEDKDTLAKQAQAMAAQDEALAHLEGLVSILQRTMSDMGLDNQIRKLLEAYVKKDIATTNLSVMQTQTERSGGLDVSGGNLSAGKDIVGGDTKT